MGGLLLETKTSLPRRRPAVVARPRLTERLDRGAEATLTVVSAPPGFGKTTLLVSWATARKSNGHTVGWLSLDHRDNDPVLFWNYLLTALTAAGLDLGADARMILQLPQPPIEAVLSSVLNDLNAVPDRVVLVIDDYHVIDTLELHEGMAFFVENLPPQVHLLIAGRADPALPLARLRGRGELVEVRAAALRFTSDEAANYLSEVMGLPLSATDVAALEGRTEGWIAALQLAALSLQGRPDATAFIADFAGDDRHIVDYLSEEVLNRQPEAIRHFLLKTAILDRLSGPLCEAVTGRPGGNATLAALERENLFLVPLDDQRHWYRYHQLFADALRVQLLDERPGDVAELHRRASAWFEQNGETAAAIEHAVAGADFERAAILVELAIPEMSRTRQESAVHGWLTLLPAGVIERRPVLTVAFAGAMLSSGRLDGVEARLSAAERLLTAAKGLRESPDAAAIVVSDSEQLLRVPAMIELYRSALAMARGDLSGTLAHAQQALAVSPPGERLAQAAAAGLSGLALWARGDLAAGHAAYSECMAGLYRAGHVADTFGCAIALADIRLTQGRLGDARHTYELALSAAAQAGGLVLRGAADMHVGLSEVFLERDDLPAVAAQLLQSEELGDHLGLRQNPYRWRVAMARVCAARGEFAAAHEFLDEAERVYVSDFFPNVRPIPALRARLWLSRGQWRPAAEWARVVGLSSMDELSYLREFEHVTLARTLLAQHIAGRTQGALSEASLLLGRLLVAADAGGRFGTVIEVLMLQALTAHAQGDTAAASAALDRALELAEPENYVRIFVNEGSAIASLLQSSAKSRPRAVFAQRLSAAIVRSGPTSATDQGLIAPLSARELDVLRLLGTDLDGPDIARRLFVSLNTLRTHTKSIFLKLGVNSRRSAVRRAQELHLQ